MSRVSGTGRTRTTCSFCECPVLIRKESIGDQTTRGKAIHALCSYKAFRIQIPLKCSMELVPFCQQCEKLVSQLHTNCVKSGSKEAKKAEQLYANIELMVGDGEVIKSGPEVEVPVDDVRRLKWTGLTDEILEGYRQKLMGKQLIKNKTGFESLRRTLVTQKPGTRKRDLFGSIAAAPSGIAGKNNSVAKKPPAPSTMQIRGESVGKTRTPIFTKSTPVATDPSTLGTNSIQIKKERMDSVVNLDGLRTSIGTLATMTQPKVLTSRIPRESGGVPTTVVGPSTTPIFYGPGPSTSWRKPLAVAPPLASTSEKVTKGKKLVPPGNYIKSEIKSEPSELPKSKKKRVANGVLDKMKKYVPSMPGVRYYIPLTEALTIGTFTVGGVQIWLCPVCNKEENDDITGDMVCCDVCDDWFHWNCVGIKEDLPKDHPWYCKRCLFDYSDNPITDFPKVFRELS